MIMEPIFDHNEPPCFMRAYRCYLHAGAFVILSGDKGDRNYPCFRILQIRDPKTVVVQPFIPFHGSGIAQLQVVEPQAKYITEICRTKQSMTINPDDIIDLAFVFKASSLIDGSVRMLQGKKNAFIIRFEEDGSIIPENECLPFSSSYAVHAAAFDTCFPCNVWWTLSRLHTEIARILSRTAESTQSEFTKFRIKTSMHASVWRYIKVEALTCGLDTRTRVVSGRVRWTKPGFCISTIRETRECELLRFETEEHLACLQGLLGETVTMNVRAKAPPVKKENNSGQDEERSLRTNDIINFVKANEQTEVPFMIRTQRGGVDLVFDGRETLLCYLRYNSVVYNPTCKQQPNDTICMAVVERKRPISLKDNYLWDGEIDTMNDEVVCVDSEFEHMGLLYVITAVHSNSIETRCIGPDEEDNSQYNRCKCFNDINYVRGQILQILE